MIHEEDIIRLGVGKNIFHYSIRKKSNWWKIIALTLLGILAIVGLACADMISVARSQIGQGELFGNNRGPAIRQYLNGREGLPWCAGFVSYCLREAGYELPYTLRAKEFLKFGKRVKNPKPGDLIVFSRQGGGHIGIVSEVYPKDKIIITIEGNLGNYPSKVKEVHYKLGRIKNFMAFVRIK